MKATESLANCRVLGVDATSADYVSVRTPFDLKKKEFADNSLVNPDENPARAREVNRRRIEKAGESVKPV